LHGLRSFSEMSNVAIRDLEVGGNWLAMSELARRIFPETAHKMILSPPLTAY
jgi:hypothetical protein